MRLAARRAFFLAALLLGAGSHAAALRPNGSGLTSSTKMRDEGSWKPPRPPVGGWMAASGSSYWSSPAPPSPSST
ncbi:MAG: hypothetical protein J3K34DRAFT_405721 [Monoraphidium minutum]|nr:MAG: hypothetical protein J3K34DRAFT_405721 [Monoraphidium minutum]